jgi:hypothetical protein
MSNLHSDSHNRQNSVSTFWAGGQLSHYETLCIKSWQKQDTQITIYSYSHDLIVPEGVVLDDARNILELNTNVQTYLNLRKYSALANLFRYHLLKVRATTWLDLDIFLLKKLPLDQDFLIGFEAENRVNNAVMRIPKNHILIDKLIEASESKNPVDLFWGQTGPYLLSDLVSEMQLTNLVSNLKVFYPISVYEIWKIFDPDSFNDIEQSTKNSVSIHLYNEMLRREWPVKHLMPPMNSWIYKKFVENEIEIPGTPRADVFWIKDALGNPKSFLINEVQNLNSEIDAKEALIKDLQLEKVSNDALIKDLQLEKVSNDALIKDLQLEKVSNDALIKKLISQIEDLKTENKELLEKIHILESKVEVTEGDLHLAIEKLLSLQRSLSWRISRPLRISKRLIVWFFSR